MHHKNIEALREEVLRLLRGQRDFLTEMLEVPGLLNAGEVNGQVHKGMVDGARAGDWLNTCESELAKVERLEMTLAVVGTMKAGKSTTINAIIGTEVLPNRNRPMTTLPTLIRHVPGQVVPRLVFPAPEPVAKTLQEIKSKLMAAQANGQLNEIPFYAASREGRELIEAILKGTVPQLDVPYEGPEAIFEFLEFLNDITRLCGDDAIDVESPLVEYDSIDEFPLIEVEFYHLRYAKGSDIGRFTLVDTPGPNEAGQSERLTRILQQQLEQASAVLAVLDYTQLGSEADDDVRKELKKIAQRSADHLFVLVNKFDAADRNSMKFEEVRTFVVEQLLDGADLEPERVYPVSSNAAYLAYRALNTLEVTGALPDADANPWVADFGDAAFGKRWAKHVDSADDVREAASELWNESRFDQPLTDVIIKSHDRAALNSIDSAVDKMREYNQTSQQMLNLRTGALQMSVEEVAGQIQNLKDDIIKVNQARALAEQRLTKAVSDFSQCANEYFVQGTDRLNRELSALFRAEKSAERKRASELAVTVPAASAAGQMRNVTNWVNLFFGGKPQNHSKLGIDPNGPNRFDDKDEAEKFKKKIFKVVDQMITEWTEKTQSATGDELKRTEKELIAAINALVSPVLKAAEERLSESFDAKLVFPTPKADTFDIDFGELSKGARVDTKEETRTRYRTERRWYTLFLKEHDVPYDVKVKVYEVDVRKIGNEVLQGLEQERRRIEAGLKLFAEKALGDSAEHYIDELADYLEAFRGELDKSRFSLEQEGKGLDQLRTAMTGLKTRASQQGEDIDQLVRGLQADDAVVHA